MYRGRKSAVLGCAGKGTIVERVTRKFGEDHGRMEGGKTVGFAQMLVMSR
jgi:hypothetical protein